MTDLTREGGHVDQRSSTLSGLTSDPYIIGT